MLKVAPYNNTMETIDDDEDGLRVLAITYTADDESDGAGGTYCCTCVNSDGELDKFIYLRKLNARLNREGENSFDTG